MATTVARLEAVLSANTRDFDRGMDQSHAKMQKVGKAAGVLGLALAGGLAIGTKQAISDASNLHEQMNKTEVVFRHNGHSVIEWSKHLSNSFGLSSRAALEFAGTFGNMLKPMGISIPLTTKMSKKLVELSGDMASFNNASIDDTLHAIQSGLAGQVRPLRQYGVFLDQNRIKLEALNLGLVHAEVDSAKVRVEQIKLNDAVKTAGEALAKSGKGSEEYVKASANVAYEESKVSKLLEGKVPILTAAQKAQASYSIIVRDTADAHGDFARTSSGLANQERILKAQLENLSAELGMALLPVMEQVTGAAIKMTGWFEKHRAATKALVISLAALSAALLTARTAQLLMNLAVLANPYVAAATAVGVLIAALIVLQVKYHAVTNAVKFLKDHLYLLLAVPVVGEFTAIALAIQPAIVAIHGISSAISHLVGWLKRAVGLVQDLIGWLGKIHVPSIPGLGSFGGGGGGGKALTSSDKQMLANTVPQVKNAVEVARENGWTGSITSGFRTYAQQAALYQRYLNGGPLAAKPGTSSHERGQAVDVTSYGAFGGIMAHTTPAARLYNRLGGADPVHYSVTGYDKGGVVSGPRGAAKLALVHGGETILPTHKGSWQSRYYDFMQRVWQFARPYFPNATGRMPPVTFTTGLDSLFVGTDFTPDAHGNIPRPGKRTMYWPKWLSFFAGRNKAVAAYETLIHEWAHQFQDVKATQGIRLGEGGAEAFAEAYTPAIYRGLGFHISPSEVKGIMGNYYGYVKWVLANKGMNWVNKGQFGVFDKGGLLQPGLTMAYNGTGRAERVVSGNGDNIVIPVSIGGEHVATVIFDQLRRKAKVFENRNGRPAFGGA